MVDQESPAVDSVRGTSRTRDRLWFAAVLVLALAIRLVVAVSFWGSNDITLQIQHGEGINLGHHAWTSKLPIGYYLPALMQKLPWHTPIPEHAAQKLPAILGDLLVAFLLFGLRRRAGSQRAWVWPAIFLLNPVTVILSSYHGNVDPLMAAATLWALTLRWRQQPSASGVAAALAIAMKPTALLSLPPLSLPMSKRAAIMLAGASVTIVAICLPFILLDTGLGQFLLSYGGPYGEWGFPLLLRQVDQHLHVLHGLNVGLEKQGRVLMIVALGSWFLYVNRKWPMQTLAQNAGAVAATWLLFYFIATGWGSQYLSMAVPFLIIASTRLAWIYVTAVTPYLLATYGYAAAFEKYAGEAVFGRLSTLPLTDVLLLFASRGFAVTAWMACGYTFWRLLQAHAGVIRSPEAEGRPTRQNAASQPHSAALSR